MESPAPGVRRICAAIAAMAAMAASGCGPGAGEQVGPVTLRVTDGFGARLLGGTQADSAPGAETAMRQLQRSHRVDTRYSGRYVQAIDGISGGTVEGRPVDWFFFVNGIESPTGAAETGLHRGDSVWWDRRDWGAATHVPAVVGMWPAPFTSGIGGKRVPVSLVCPKDFERQCARVEGVLAAEKVPTARGLPGIGGRGAGIRVIVGDWRSVRHDRAGVLVSSGPGFSGVYVRPADDGRTIAVLGPTGTVRSTQGPGTGLVAATADADSPPTWFITGTDTAGVDRAIGSLHRSQLAGRYALVVPAGGQAFGAPLK